jgi:hypothetical protein
MYILERAKFLDHIIITNFGTIKQKRLIVDGIQRPIALTICSEIGVSIPVLECYGCKIDLLFPCKAHSTLNCM